MTESSEAKLANTLSSGKADYQSLAASAGNQEANTGEGKEDCGVVETGGPSCL